MYIPTVLHQSATALNTTQLPTHDELISATSASTIVAANNQTTHAVLSTSSQLAQTSLGGFIQMASTRDLTILAILFLFVIVFQVYVYLKIDENNASYEDLDVRRKEEERKRREEMLMKALSAF